MQAVASGPAALQAPGLIQAPMSAMQPLQSMVGMFANPGHWWSGRRREPRRLRRPVGYRPRPPRSVRAAEAPPWAACACWTSFTRPVSAFESGTSGRPVGLRPSGALGADVVRAPTTTVGGTPIGGMPVGHAAGGHRGSHGKSEQAATVRVVDDRR
ncbi:hypothetical protein J113_27175 [Mycobacterium tuberculosis CAS/NITR204]|uniref:PPE family protein n=1 Tax=Mycobacterium tuberculosis CAS/NITR204 TaxID=1310114 RepID=R4MPJ2_MYCTX|nr:hypothetical protein J113_27175 [Mycobacterium tuberculosis CAS/NITR204]